MESNTLALFNERKETTIIGKAPATAEDRKALYNAVSVPTGKLKTLVNMELELVNFQLERTMLTNEEGEAIEAVATTILTADGGSYTTVSNGIFKALQTICSIYGMPSEWEGPIKVRPVQREFGRGSMLTFELI